jgi:hypothetical protein
MHSATTTALSPTLSLFRFGRLFLLVRELVRGDFRYTRDDLRGKRFERARLFDGAEEDRDVCEEESSWDLQTGSEIVSGMTTRMVARTVMPSWVMALVVSDLEEACSMALCLRGMALMLGNRVKR